MELWFTEKIEEEVGLTSRIKSTLLTENAPSRRVEILETESLVKMTFLSGAAMLTKRDAFFHCSSITRGLIK